VDFALKHKKTPQAFELSLVSILVLVDFALKPEGGSNITTSGHLVSILVLVDFALKPGGEAVNIENLTGFNPCFGGFCSKTHPCETFFPIQ